MISFSKMYILNNLIVFSLFLSFRSFRVKANDDSYYTAGVVEFRPIVTAKNSSEALTDHLQGYLDILESNAVTDIDIIVFPESTLNNEIHPSYVPSEQEKIIPCLTNTDNIYADFLVQLSCAARRVSKYVVINLNEKENCLPYTEDPRTCAGNNLNIFNTNVVFDREGRVISRYRKVHVYVNSENTTYTPEFGIFNTDFGVRFGHFICFDILFYTPAQELVDRFGVTDFIFTTYFFSELPFLTAVQLQHGWAWGNNVNLLAAGASYPEWGVTGSGIFSGRFGDLVSVMVTEKGERKLYKARVPKHSTNYINEIIKETTPQTHDISKLRLLKDPQIQNYNSVLLDLAENTTSFNQELCDGDFCCTFKINAKVLGNAHEQNFKFRVGIFDGRRTYQKEEWSDIKVCALYTCASEHPNSCGEAFLTGNILFESIEINGNFPKVKKLMIMPSIINDQLHPLQHYTVEWSKIQQNQHYEVNLKLVQEQTNILTFGIYGQFYENSMAASIKTCKPGNAAFFILLPLLLGVKEFTNFFSI